MTVGDLFWNIWNASAWCIYVPFIVFTIVRGCELWTDFKENVLDADDEY